MTHLTPISSHLGPPDTHFLVDTRNSAPISSYLAHVKYLFARRQDLGHPQAQEVGRVLHFRQIRPVGHCGDTHFLALKLD